MALPWLTGALSAKPAPTGAPGDDIDDSHMYYAPGTEPEPSHAGRAAPSAIDSLVANAPWLNPGGGGGGGGASGGGAPAKSSGNEAVCV